MGKRVSILFVTALFIGGVTFAFGASFVGSKKCKMCHIKQYKSWQTTKMAKAFDLLKAGVNADAKSKAGLDAAKDYTGDAECLKCHVTGYGKPGGFKSIAQTPNLAGVGCETCHGAGSEYLKAGKMTNKNKAYKKADLVAVGLVSPPTKTQCTGCHNADSPFVESGYVFDFKTKVSEGTHEHRPLKYKHE